MSRPYDVGDHRLNWQIREDLLPEFDCVGEPFDAVMWERAWEDHHAEVRTLPVVFGVTAARVPASADAWPPLAPDPPPIHPGPAAASTSSRLHPPA